MNRFLEICKYVFSRKISIFGYIFLIADLIMCAVGKSNFSSFMFTLSILLAYNFIIVLLVMFSERRG